MMKTFPSFSLAILLFLTGGCNSLTIVKKPVTFNDHRKQLSLDYLKQRHGIDTEQAAINPKMIVIHYTVIPTLEGTMRAFMDPELPASRNKIKGASQLNVSAQFVIDRDGTVYQLFPEETTFARHTIGLNYCAFGIENIGDAKDNPLTDAQLQANVDLVTYLKKKYPEVEYLIGHQEYNLFRNHSLWKETDPNYRTEKTDPGIAFMKNLRKKVKVLELKGPDTQSD